MEYITAIKDTLLKKSYKDSSKDPTIKKINFRKNKKYPVKNWQLSKNNHLLVELGYGAGSWYVHIPHIYFKPLEDYQNKLKSLSSKDNYSSNSRYLTEEDFKKGSALLGCSVAALKAVVAIESAGKGFYNSGKPKILFEAHWFGTFTNHKYAKSHPHLSSRYWNRSLYRLGGSVWDRFNAAAKLDRNAAIKATSFGLFQVMGFHYSVCGYSSPEAYYQAQFESEWEHLKCAIAFIKDKGLDKHLKSLNWTKFAYGYNGELYFKHGYHTKLARAYKKFLKQSK